MSGNRRENLNDLQHFHGGAGNNFDEDDLAREIMQVDHDDDEYDDEEEGVQMSQEQESMVDQNFAEEDDDHLHDGVLPDDESAEVDE